MNLSKVEACFMTKGRCKSFIVILIDFQQTTARVCGFALIERPEGKMVEGVGMPVDYVVIDRRMLTDSLLAMVVAVNEVQLPERKNSVALVVGLPLALQFAKGILQLAHQLVGVVLLDAGTAVLSQLEQAVVVVAHEQVCGFPCVEELDTCVPVVLHRLTLLLGRRASAKRPEVEQIAAENAKVWFEVLADFVENLDGGRVLAIPVQIGGKDEAAWFAHS